MQLIPMEHKNGDSPARKQKPCWVVLCNWQLLGFWGKLWYPVCEVMFTMEAKQIILELRVKNGLSQEELAERVYVTRQGSLPLGAGGDGPQYGDAETALEAL